jgi:gamma-glutamyl hydrolase
MCKQAEKLPLLFAIMLLSLVPKASPINNKPIIGILTTPSDFPWQYEPGNWSYFPASYVKFLETVGARVVPIPYDAPYENLTYLFKGTNGLLFPGGGANQYIDDPWISSRVRANVTMAAAWLLHLAIEANDNGDYYPIWLPCQGCELFSQIVSNDLFLLDNVTGDVNVNRTMAFTKKAETSKIWKDLPDSLWNWIQYENVTFF